MKTWLSSVVRLMIRRFNEGRRPTTAGGWGASLKLDAGVRLLLLAGVVACARPAPVVAESQGAPAETDGGTAVLPSADFGAPGPIRAVGYPVRIRMGANDPAHRVGFTRDGRWFGYCNTDGGLGATHCAFVDGAGERRTMSTREEAERGNLQGPQLAELNAWLAANEVPAVKERGLETTGPELGGTWRYARDIQIHITASAGEVGADQNVVRQPVLRIGGQVTGHSPVYPYELTTKRAVGTPVQFYGVFPNGVALSPDGREIGVVAAWHGMEFAGDFATLRVSVDAFAARVYDDTGSRLLERGDLAGAQELFSKATSADPSFALAPYNLARAYAKTGDGRAEIALGMAIARGGRGVVERARADVDFDGVRTRPWFTALVK
ncbi:MAG: tetratricopeptide repeat protein [Myxococcales bacterium]|nr:tetratricopeptide repeat protein [Myxococcales bacterium]